MKKKTHQWPKQHIWHRLGPFSAPPGFLPFRPYCCSHWRCCCLFFLAVVVVVGVVVVEVSEEVAVVVLVIDVVVNDVVVVVVPGCCAKYLYRIIFYRKYIFLYGSVVNCEYLIVLSCLLSPRFNPCT